MSLRINWLDLLVVQGTLRVFSSITIWKHQFVSAQPSFMIQLSHPYITTGKTIALTIWTFVSKVLSMFFNMLSRFVVAFLPRSKSLLISWLQSLPAVILEPQNRKSVTDSTFSFSICHEVMGLDAMILVFECWFLSQLFQSPLSSSRGSLVPLCFLPLEWYHLHIWGCWYFSQQPWFQFLTQLMYMHICIHIWPSSRASLPFPNPLL